MRRLGLFADVVEHLYRDRSRVVGLVGAGGVGVGLVVGGTGVVSVGGPFGLSNTSLPNGARPGWAA